MTRVENGSQMQPRASLRPRNHHRLFLEHQRPGACGDAASAVAHVDLACARLCTLGEALGTQHRPVPRGCAFEPGAER